MEAGRPVGQAGRGHVGEAPRAATLMHHAEADRAERARQWAGRSRDAPHPHRHTENHRHHRHRAEHPAQRDVGRARRGTQSPRCGPDAARIFRESARSDGDLVGFPGRREPRRSLRDGVWAAAGDHGPVQQPADACTNAPSSRFEQRRKVSAGNYGAAPQGRVSAAPKPATKRTRPPALRSCGHLPSCRKRCRASFPAASPAGSSWCIRSFRLA